MRKKTPKVSAVDIKEAGRRRYGQPMVMDLESLPVVLRLDDIMALYRCGRTRVLSAVRAGTFEPAPFIDHPYRWAKEDVLRDMQKRRRPLRGMCSVRVIATQRLQRKKKRAEFHHTSGGLTVAESTSTALAPMAAADIVEGEAMPMPVFSGAQMAQAFTAYRDLQKALDAAMPDQLQQIGKKMHRKKGYWRAVRVAFNLKVEPIEERREVACLFGDGRENFGYHVVYRATAQGGASVCGDGSCFAVEKAEKFRCPHPQDGNPSRSDHWPHETCPDYDRELRFRELPLQASEHNVRSHAHTRAFNRAVSNLVGFGEVSAEEVDRDHHDDDDAEGGTVGHRRASSGGGSGARISEPQRKRMYAISKQHGWSDEQVHEVLKRYGFEHSADVTRAKYEQVCFELERKGQSQVIAIDDNIVWSTVSFTPPELAFDEARHRYTWKGTELISVTKVLKGAGFVDESYYTEGDAGRGQRAHAAIQLLHRGELRDRHLDAEILPFVQAYQVFLADSGFRADASEERVCDASLQCAGTLDLRGQFLDAVNRRIAGCSVVDLVDIKTGSVPSWVGYQTAGYARLLPIRAAARCRRWVLKLRGDGGYTLTPLTKRSDERVFLAALTVAHAKLGWLL